MVHGAWCMVQVRKQVEHDDQVRFVVVVVIVVIVVIVRIIDIKDSQLVLSCYFVTWIKRGGGEGDGDGGGGLLLHSSMSS